MSEDGNKTLQSEPGIERRLVGHLHGFPVYQSFSSIYPERNFQKGDFPDDIIWIESSEQGIEG